MITSVLVIPLNTSAVNVAWSSIDHDVDYFYVVLSNSSAPADSANVTGDSRSAEFGHLIAGGSYTANVTACYSSNG